MTSTRNAGKVARAAATTADSRLPTESPAESTPKGSPKASPVVSTMKALIPCNVILLVLVLVPLFKLWMYSQPLSFVYPNSRLFLTTEAARNHSKEVWREAKKGLLDKSIKMGHIPVSTIDAADYTYEKLRVMTENFNLPGVVRGLFKDTPAVATWGDNSTDKINRLNEIIGKYEIPVVQNGTYGSTQSEKKNLFFQDAYNQILQDTTSDKYLFFPLLSREHASYEDKHENLMKDVQRLMIEDLQIDKKIWPGFGTSIHNNYYGAQFVIGRGQAKDNAEQLKTTGTGWHCAIGSNYFVQVVGRKRWYFLDPKYTPYMSPVRGGIVHVVTADRFISEYHDNLPLRYIDLEPGDLLFNPAWEWHTIQNYEGVSIGVPIREFTLSQSFWNNNLLTSLVVWNKLLLRLGFDLPTF